MILYDNIIPNIIGERFLIVSEGIDLNSAIRVLTTPKLSPKLISKALFELSKEYPLYRRDSNKANNKKIKYSTISIVPIKGIFYLSFLVNNNEAISGFYRKFETIKSESDSLLGVKMNGDVERINLNDLKQK